MSPFHAAPARLWAAVERHPAVALVAACAALYGVRLGSSDLRQWDEVFYASRALVAGHDGHWLDQSATALSGLWAGSHPPLVVWMMALSGLLLGFGEWAFRLPIALCGAAAVLLLRRLVLDLTDRPRTALLAAVVLLLTPLFTRYARMGQLDVPVVLWIVLALFAFRRGLQGGAWWTVLAGAAFGLVLLSKLAVGLLVPMTIAIFLAWEWLRGSRTTARRGLGSLVALSALGLLLAAPWFAAISARLGRAYWDQALGYHVLARMKGPLEGHASSLGPLYWPLQIVVRLAAFTPLAALGMSRRATSGALDAAGRRFLWSWLLVPFGLFSLSATTYHTYLLLFLLPLVVFAALGLDLWLAAGPTRAWLGWTIAAAIGAVVWAQTRPLQMAAEDVARALRGGAAPAPGEAVSLAAFAALVVALGLAAAALARGFDEARRRRVARWSLGALVLLPAFLMAWEPVGSGGAEWIALRRSVLRQGCREVVFAGGETPVNRMNLALLEARGVTVRFAARADSAAVTIAGPCQISLGPRASRSR